MAVLWPVSSVIGARACKHPKVHHHVIAVVACVVFVNQNLRRVVHTEIRTCGTFNLAASLCIFGLIGCATLCLNLKQTARGGKKIESEEKVNTDSTKLLQETD